MDSGLGLMENIQQKGHGEREKERGTSKGFLLIWPLVGTRLAGEEGGMGWGSEAGYSRVTGNS